MTTGSVNLPQTRVIAHSLTEVTADLDADELLEAERTMIREAKHLDPRQLRILGRHLADVVDPAGAQQREADRIAEEEERAAVRTRLSLHSQGDGTTRITGLLSDAVARRLEKALDSLAQPRLKAADADGLRTPRHRLLGLALGDLLERINPEKLPAHGGDATTIVVTITLDQLRTQLGTAGLGFDDHTPISAAEARRLACSAHIIPMVLGGAGQVLDAGRAARFHTPMMRKVIRLRDKTCRATGCAVPAEWCDIHHWQPWSQGGRTSVKDGGLLCSHHHHRIHSPDYQHTRQPDGAVEFHKRC